MNTYTAPLPCRGHEALYDIVLFGDATTTAERLKATRQAAALCGSCPSPCAQKINVPSVVPASTTENHTPSYAAYIAHKRRGEEACEGCMEAKRAYDREQYAKAPEKARARRLAYEARIVDQPIVVSERIAVMAAMAAELASAGRTSKEVASGLCVTEQLAVELIALSGRRMVLERAA